MVICQYKAHTILATLALSVGSRGFELSGLLPPKALDSKSLGAINCFGAGPYGALLRL